VIIYQCFRGTCCLPENNDINNISIAEKAQTALTAERQDEKFL
jgi:hypothetical protein